MNGSIHIQSQIRNDCHKIIESMRVIGFTCSIKEKNVIRCHDKSCWNESACIINFSEKTLPDLRSAINTIQKNNNVYKHTINVIGSITDLDI